MADGFPVRRKEFCLTLHGTPATVVCCLYIDRLLFIVNQIGTFGTILHAQKEAVLDGGHIFSVKTLLGPRDSLLPELCVRQLIEDIANDGCQLPVILCLGTKRYVDNNINDRNELGKLVKTLVANRIW